MSMLAAAAAVLSVTVRVYDLYGLPPEQRARALALAAETLAHANVSTTWIDCSRVDGVAPPACVAVLKEGELVLRFQGRTERGEHILGSAIVQDTGPSVLASVYAGAIADRSARTGLPMATILGRVTAHEIGHLLLGTNSHAPNGLMQASWNLRRPHVSEWRFTRNDAEKMRRRLLARSEGVVAQAVDAPIPTTRMATTVMSSAWPLAPAKASSADGTSDR
jgi:hypothetical protein